MKSIYRPINFYVIYIATLSQVKEAYILSSILCLGNMCSMCNSNVEQTDRQTANTSHCIHSKTISLIVRSVVNETLPIACRFIGKFMNIQYNMFYKIWYYLFLLHLSSSLNHSYLFMISTNVYVYLLFVYLQHICLISLKWQGIILC